ncbi:AbrB/MazE/SpoVT family DNA-binding domain-containing protein [Fictibacillus sp. FJAT-27399]|uniref:AbrB/MazE/SpoVT family DNA-binding domain-containing protein n=1 Tax=Fictibacillus sp. FJAT-27399 TaxID=1729689 RepID=UPI0007847910|nr:AbrB/MazE/SpoVT family DNA-binding domain-containing protein [Fictibacillus sp. FJAT-27399]
MKSTGIVRNVDELGRIVVPIELRRTQDLQIKDPVEIFVEGEQIILKKYTAYNACMVTGEVLNDNISLANGKITLSREETMKLIIELKDKLQIA